jgi:hypothetical protein
MTLKAIPMVTVICDHCGESADEGSDFGAWSSEQSARDVAASCDWVELDGKDYCPRCVKWSEDGGEQRPKPPLAIVHVPVAG